MHSNLWQFVNRKKKNRLSRAGNLHSAFSLSKHSYEANLEASLQHLLHEPGALLCLKMQIKPLCVYISIYIYICTYIKWDFYNFCPRWTTPFLMSKHLHNDAAIIWSQRGLLSICGLIALYLHWSKRSNLWIGEEQCMTLPWRRVYASHATRMLTGCTKVCSGSSLPSRQWQRSLGRVDGTPNFLCGRKRKKSFDHRLWLRGVGYSELTLQECLIKHMTGNHPADEVIIKSQQSVLWKKDLIHFKCQISKILQIPTGSRKTTNTVSLDATIEI